MPEKIRRCQTYIEERLGKTIPAGALEESCGDLKVLSFKNVDIYHQVAQALGITKVIKSVNIHYTVNIPNDAEWSIILSHYYKREFEEKYGIKYNIVKPRFEPINTDILSKEI